MSASYPEEGGCMCGAIRFRLVGPPYAIDYCHCASCRKHTGAPVSVFLDCKRDVFELMKGDVAFYKSSPDVQRGFCSVCGSTLSYETDALAGEIHIHVGAMDHPERFPPNTKDAFPEERLPWFHIAQSGP